MKELVSDEEVTSLFKNDSPEQFKSDELVSDPPPQQPASDITPINLPTLIDSEENYLNTMKDKSLNVRPALDGKPKHPLLISEVEKPKKKKKNSN